MDPHRWQQLKELFQAALELEPARRPAFLDRACGGEPALRREIESLLAHQLSAGSFLESPAAAALAELQGVPPTIGPYELGEELGRGGMGVVYRARHRQSGQVAALKTVLRVHKGHLGRIRREIHALARIRHPGIVRILDEGEQDGVPWYAMELLEGLTLRGYLRERVSRTPTRSVAGSGPDSQRTGLAASPRHGRQAEPSSAVPEPRGTPAPEAAAELPEALTLVRRLCAPLAFLHGEGIVHRDLKPDNVLLRVVRSGQDEPAADARSLIAHRSSLIASCRPVLMDFGLVTRFGGDISREVLEVEAAPAGTLSYMAPEQLRGEFVDARADLYALGCLMYELISGRPPFVSKTPSGLIQAHLQAEPQRPSEWVEGVPAELDALVLRLLAKEPRQRLGHAGDVAAALAALGAEDGLAAAGPRPRAYLYRPRLAGREDLLGELSRGLDALESGSGGVVLLGGESGVGKTRLLMEVAREAARRKLQVLSGECLGLGDGGWATGVSPELGIGQGAASSALTDALHDRAAAIRESGEGAASSALRVHAEIN